MGFFKDKDSNSPAEPLALLLHPREPLRPRRGQLTVEALGPQERCPL